MDENSTPDHPECYYPDYGFDYSFDYNSNNELDGFRNRDIENNNENVDRSSSYKETTLALKKGDPENDSENDPENGTMAGALVSCDAYHLLHFPQDGPRPLSTSSRITADPSVAELKAEIAKMRKEQAARQEKFEKMALKSAESQKELSSKIGFLAKEATRLSQKPHTNSDEISMLNGKLQEHDSHIGCEFDDTNEKPSKYEC
ncbi:hypothetical protein FSPOR_7919 [Fusarium sporotrichioides]|uniref:Uncharacterized protein n=1 Tax=Fusarium sporotrichioides TaxID=5514 RepID=A0A395RWQ4_FUSSP|nr:hypothetical protein FSPOR_7919 [Fusarium sporotrichioides]